MSEQTPTPTDLDELLALRFDSDAGQNLTIREWFIDLARLAWTEGEGFSGKRPWGNSGWESAVYLPLVKHGAMPGELAENGGWLDDWDDVVGQALVANMLDHMANQS